jgi:cytochrome P450
MHVAEMGADAQLVDLDLFDPVRLKNPFDTYRQLRDAGPTAQLLRPEVYAIGRFYDVQAALRADTQLRSGEGVGFSDSFNATSKGGSLIQSDGAYHRRLRANVMRPLTPANLRKSRSDLKAMVATRVGALVGKGCFEAMTDLASFLPIAAVSHLVGLPDFGRDRMLEWAGATFNLIGPNQTVDDLATLDESRAFMATLNENTVREGSWAGELFAAVQNGRLSQLEAMAAIAAYIIPSLDTTILAKGHLLNNLANNPDQWALLKKRPDLIPAAVIESARRDAVIRWFSRVVAVDYQVGDFIIPKGKRIMLLYGCANRDERRYADPDRFDVTRDSRDQLAWGTGPHMCVGMNLARLEMEVLIEALVEADATLTVGEPVVGINQGLYGFTSLPLAIA